MVEGCPGWAVDDWSCAMDGSRPHAWSPCMGHPLAAHGSSVALSPHLERVPGVGTLSAGGLAGGDAQGLGGHADGSLHLELLILGTLDQVSAHCVFKVLAISMIFLA